MPPKNSAWGGGKPNSAAAAGKGSSNQISSSPSVLTPGPTKPRINIVWFKHTDLRIHDHAPLKAAHSTNNKSSSKIPVLHLFVFDPFWYENTTRICKFPKTGPIRAKFQIESVADLARNLRKKTVVDSIEFPGDNSYIDNSTMDNDIDLIDANGHRLYYRHGISTVKVFEEIMQSFDIQAVFAYHEICSEELRIQKGIEKVINRGTVNGVSNTKLNLFWGFELYHLDDLPFDPFKNPRGAFNSYTAFRKRCEDNAWIRPSSNEEPVFQTTGVKWKKKYEFPATDNFEQLPISVETLLGTELYAKSIELVTEGWSENNNNASSSESESHAFPEQHPNAALKWIGGETAGLAHIHNYIWKTESLYFDYVGATMTTNPAKSCMQERGMFCISPWLAHGCVSPRLLYEEVQKYEKQKRKNKSTYWITHELLWRDFVRFGSMCYGNKIFLIGGPTDTEVGGTYRGEKWGWEWRQPNLENISRKSNTTTFNNANTDFLRWYSGYTGFPFLDSFMRELKYTGYTNHMGRETNGWFLVGDLGIDWRCGGEWYEFTLIDYEPTANWFNWTYRCLTASGRGHSQIAGDAEAIPGAILEERRDKAISEGYNVDNYEKGKLGTMEVLIWGTQHDPDSKFIKKWIPELDVNSGLKAIEIREPWRLMGSDKERLAGKKFQIDDTHEQNPDQNLDAEIFESGWSANASSIDQLLGIIGTKTQGSESEQREETTRCLYLAWDDLQTAVGIAMERRETKAKNNKKDKNTSNFKKDNSSDVVPTKPFRYGIDYPIPVMRPVSMANAAENEVFSRNEQNKEKLKTERERKKYGAILVDINDGINGGSHSGKKSRFKPNGRAPVMDSTTDKDWSNMDTKKFSNNNISSQNNSSDSGNLKQSKGSGNKQLSSESVAATTRNSGPTIAQKAKRGRWKKDATD